MPGSASDTHENWARFTCYAYRWKNPGVVKSPQFRIDDIDDDGTVRRATFQTPLSSFDLSSASSKLKQGSLVRLSQSVFWLGSIETEPGLNQIDLYDYEVNTLIKKAKKDDGFLRRWIG